MMQQINLYQPEKRKLRLDLNFRHMAWIFGIFVGTLVLITSYDMYKHLTIRKELNILGKEQMAKTEKLQVIAGQIPEEQTRNQIISEIKKFEAEKKEKQEVLFLLTSAQENKIGGFSDYFEALAEEVVPGLWITEFGIKENGTYLSLQGMALKPEFVPQLIAKLDAQPTFTDKTFSLFKMELNEKTKLVEFVLETRAVQQP